MKKTTFLLPLIAVLCISKLSAQSAQSNIKTEQVQITDCSNAPIHFMMDYDNKQHVRFIDFYSDILENEKTFYLADGRVEKVEKYYHFIKPITETHTYHYSVEEKKEIVTIKKNNILYRRTIKNSEKDEIINDVYDDEGKIKYKVFSRSGEDYRFIQYDKSGNVVKDEQNGAGDRTRTNYNKKELSNGNTEISYTDGNTQTIEIYNSKGDKISYSNVDIYDDLDEFINHNGGRLAKPVNNAKPKGNFSFFGIETEFQGNKKIETQTSYAEYVRNNTVYRTPEETEIRIYNQQGAIVELINKYGEKESFSYNEKDQLLERKKESSEGVLMMKIKYSYKNELLNEIKVIDVSNNQVAMQIALEYTFDNQGNWIKMRYLSDGKCQHIKNRTLTYY